MTVNVEGADLTPITAFSQLSVHASLSRLYSAFTTPSPIQRYAWPALFGKHDVVGISQTGSGKTLAFSLPILDRLLNKYSKKPALIRWITIAPTRELAQQTYSVISQVVPAVCLYGGVPKRDQLKELREKQPLAIVATPGRLLDLLEAGEVRVSRAKFLVLDEADRMLDAGFEPAVSAIVAKLPAKRQTVLFSATWPSSVQKMANKYTKKPIKITISNRGLEDGSSISANVSITQIVHVVEPSEKDDYLFDELSRLRSPFKVIVFVLYKREAPQVESLLRRRGFTVHGLHGDMSQPDRTAALDSFKTGTASILIATDVAARGLDIPAVSLVFNYTFPLTVEDYVHRIGRTGRGGAAGRAVTLFTAHEKGLAGPLQNVLRQAGQPIPEALLAFGTATKRKVHREYGAFYKDPADMPPPSKITFDSD